MTTAGEATPKPERVPRPYLAVEPWPGFWPVPGDEDPELPLDAVAQFSRWEGLRRALAERGSRAAREVPSPALAEGVGDRTGPEPPFLARESESFKTLWPRILEEGRANRSLACRELLEIADPATLAGEQAARELLFAAVVGEGDRSAADSLYYRMSWNDAGRTVSRLTAWRTLEEGKGEQAVRALNAISEPTAGEEACLAVGEWLADPDGAGFRVPEWQDTEGLARQILALADCRRALVSGDMEGARETLRSVQPDLLPPEWMDTASRLRDLTRADHASTGDSPELAEFEKARTMFLAREDAGARARLDAWLAAWPHSPLRPNALFLRAHLEAAAGSPQAAESDLRAAETKLSAPESLARVRLVRAFVLAQLGRGAEARATLNDVLQGPLGETAEAEIRFDQSRLARLLDDEEMQHALVLQLEEAFPSWADRARKDTVSSHWRDPWRSPLPNPSPAPRVEAPREGPWSQLLWGENFLEREAERLTEETDVRVVGPSSMIAHAVETPRPSVDPSTPLAFVDVGLGAPAALILGGGVGGLSEGVHYRLDGARTFSEGRNELPDYRRTDWEAGIAGSPGNWRLGLVAEGSARTDDEASRIGLNPGQVDASWFGVRGDVGVGKPEDEGLSISAAAIEGQVDAGNGNRWESDQQWYAVSAGVRPGETRWETELTLAQLENRQRGLGDFRRWYHDLRVARSLSRGWFLGVRASLYLKRALVMPVAGVERKTESGLTFWAATEPSLELPSFRETFVSSGDWNVPDLSLPAVRRYLDLRGGVRWSGHDGNAIALAVEGFKAGELRSWRRPDPTDTTTVTPGLWTEHAEGDATGFKAIFSGAFRAGGARVSGKAVAQSVRAAGNQVPYVPRYEGWLELSYAYRGWRWGATLKGVGGREDETRERYGDYLRLDLEAAYRFKSRSLPLDLRNLELAVGIENLTDVDDLRWPGIPPYGFGIVFGVRTLFGD